MSRADTSRNVTGKIVADAKTVPSCTEEPAEGSHDQLEAALAGAPASAATANRFDVVTQLARELEARCLARAGIVVRLARCKG